MGRRISFGYPFFAASALESQGKSEEALGLCSEWASKETDNPYAAAALIYAKINVNDLEGAEELVKQHISDDTVCDEENDRDLCGSCAACIRRTEIKRWKRRWIMPGKNMTKSWEHT